MQSEKTALGYCVTKIILMQKLIFRNPSNSPKGCEIKKILIKTVIKQHESVGVVLVELGAESMYF